MITIDGVSYEPGKPMIVAEIGANHCGDLDLAERLVRAASYAGADAVKFQVYKPSDLTVQSELPHFQIPDGRWKGSLWDLYERAQTPIRWIPELAKLAKDLGLHWFCSVFDPSVVDELEEMECPAYKIASPEAEWTKLLSVVSDTGKSVIVSDGMLDAEGRTRIRGIVGSNAIMLRCVSEYPAQYTSYGFADRPAGPWGLSDHSMSPTMAVAPIVAMTAAALGSCVVEAHLKLFDNDYDGLPMPDDWAHSMDPDAFRRYASYARGAAKLAYTDRAHPDNPPWRRRLVWATDLPAGHVVQTEDILCVRAGAGAEPRRIYFMLGKPLLRNVSAFEPTMERTVK